MSILGKIFGAGGQSIIQPVTAVGNILDSLFTSKDEKLTHEEVRMRLMMEPEKAQVEINKLEAQHRSKFVAGWRPFIGWVCGFALLYSFILRDIIAWGIRIFSSTTEINELGVQVVKYSIEAPPELAMEHLLTVLLGMLGLGGMRTYEKLKGTSK